MSQALLLDLRLQLRRAADPARARDMQRYMKSTMAYHGVTGPLQKQIFRKIFKGLEFRDALHWRRTVLHIFRNACFREEWYAAVALCECRQAAKFQTPDVLPLYEEMIVTAAWWDVVDATASHSVGTLLRSYPKPLKKEMRAWSRCGNMWKRRASIICQLGSKQDTDLTLLYSCIEQSVDSKEFFLRKAIGWALRQYAWTDPEEVRRYVRANARLSPLSRREALKNIGGGETQPG
jgi:3-methyladenine DNA glycosylase AlkD